MAKLKRYDMKKSRKKKIAKPLYKSMYIEHK